MRMTPRQDDDFFWDGVDRGELLAQRCEACETLRHPPLPRCLHCGSPDWHAEPLSGRGTVLASVDAVHPGRRDEEPRRVCLIDLAEGIRFVSTVLDGDRVENGVPVEVTFETLDGHLLPLFRTAGAQA